MLKSNTSLQSSISERNASDTSINDIEDLSSQIGINLQIENKDYQWFIHNVKKGKLPNGWIKDPESNYYVNLEEGFISSTHPLIRQFRKLFHQVLADEKKINEKTEADPEMEKVREIISKQKSSKNEKTQIKKRMTKVLTNINISKVKNNLNPDVTMELFDNNNLEKFNKYINILDQKKKLGEKKIIVRPCPPSLLQENLESFSKYYFETYGEDVVHLYNERNNIWKNFEYADPYSVYKSLKTFEINSKEYYLFWLAQLYNILELAPNFEEKYIDSENELIKIYLDKETGLYFNMHPSFYYILQNMKTIKDMQKIDQTIFGEGPLTFKDGLNRVAEVNFTDMLKENEEKKFFEHQKNAGEKEDEQESDSHSSREVEEEGSSRKKERKNLKYHNRMNSSIFFLCIFSKFFEDSSDLHILTIAGQIGLDLPKEIHLLAIMYEFIVAKDENEAPDNIWRFRYLKEGLSFWINHKQKKAITEYPYLKEIKVLIDAYKRELSMQYGKYLLSRPTDSQNELKKYFKLKKLNEILHISKRETENFIKEYLEFKQALMMKHSEELEGSKWSYQIKFLQKYLKHPENMNTEEIQNILFYCRLDLEGSNQRNPEDKEKKDEPQIKFIGFEAVEPLHKPEKSNILTDFLVNPLTRTESISSIEGIDEQKVFQMNDFIERIISSKYQHLNEEIRTKLLHNVLEDINLILPYLMLSLVGKKEEGDNDQIENDDEIGTSKSFQDLLDDKSDPLDYKKNLLKTLDYKYFREFDDIIKEKENFNKSLIKKLNKFIFHKYREIILNLLLINEDFDKFVSWEEEEPEFMEELNNNSGTSEDQTDVISIMDDDMNEPKNSKNLENQRKSTDKLDILRLASKRKITTVVSLKYIVDKNENSESSSQKKIPFEFSQNTIEEKLKSSKAIIVSRKTVLGAGASVGGARQSRERNHFMKQLTRVTLEEKKLRRTLLNLTYNNPPKKITEYTLPELHQEIEKYTIIRKENNKKMEEIKKQSKKKKIKIVVPKYKRIKIDQEAAQKIKLVKKMQFIMAKKMVKKVFQKKKFHLQPQTQPQSQPQYTPKKGKTEKIDHIIINSQIFKPLNFKQDTKVKFSNFFEFSEFKQKAEERRKTLFIKLQNSLTKFNGKISLYAKNRIPLRTRFQSPQAEGKEDAGSNHSAILEKGGDYSDDEKTSIKPTAEENISFFPLIRNSSSFKSKSNIPEEKSSVSNMPKAEQTFLEIKASFPSVKKIYFSPNLVKSKLDNPFRNVPKYVEYETAENLLNKARRQIEESREGRFSSSPKRIKAPLVPLFFPNKGSENSLRNLDQQANYIDLESSKLHSFNNLNSPMNRRGSKPLKYKWRLSKSPQINTVTENIIEESNGMNLMIKGLINVNNANIPTNPSVKPNFYRKSLKEIQLKIRKSRINREEKNKVVDWNNFILMPKKLEIKEKKGNLLNILGKSSIKEDLSDDMKKKYKMFKKRTKSFDLKQRIKIKKMNKFIKNLSFEII